MYSILACLIQKKLDGVSIQYHLIRLILSRLVYLAVYYFIQGMA